MSIIFEPVTGSALISEVARLAREIWTEHYVPIIGQPQVDYMLDRFQSESAIAGQISDESYEYFLVRSKQDYAGYIGVQRRQNELFLSKLYIRSGERGKGIGRKAINFVEDLAGKYALACICLTVNKDNKVAITVYEKCGFVNTGPIVTDIGNGFVMDDYRLRKTISPQPFSSAGKPRPHP